MKSLIDLHIHSNNSLDGQFSIDQIVNIALTNGLKTISICDHNYFNDYCSKNIEMINGVELDVIYQGLPFHLLYYYDEVNAEIVKLVDEYNLSLRHTNILAINKFIDYFDLDFTYDDLQFLSKDGIIVFEELGEYLFNNDKYQDYEFVTKLKHLDNRAVSFYWEYFSFNKIAYIREDYNEALHIIDLINKSGGLAIIAHPMQNFRNDLDKLKTLVKLVDGIELYSSYHNKDDIELLCKVFDDDNLIYTCGSDFHGINKPNIVIGKFLMNFDDTLIRNKVDKLVKFL